MRLGFKWCFELCLCLPVSPGPEQGHEAAGRHSPEHVGEHSPPAPVWGQCCADPVPAPQPRCVLHPELGMVSGKGLQACLGMREQRLAPSWTLLLCLSLRVWELQLSPATSHGCSGVSCGSCSQSSIWVCHLPSAQCSHFPAGTEELKFGELVVEVPPVLEPDGLEKLVLTRGLLTCCKVDILSCQLEGLPDKVGKLNLLDRA